jgi:predicted signal transduction protein with EAL and GGDEF domain
LPDAVTVARLGGDEFIALLPGSGVRDAIDAARRAQDALELRFHLDGITTPVAASAGIAVSPDHGHDRAELMRHADIAMYRAKTTGSFVEVFTAHDSAMSRARLILAGELQHAIDADQLVLHYQPKVDVCSGAVAGVEALVRWQHPERGLLMPDVFLPIAERNGLMGRVTLRVLDIALAQQHEWRARGIDLQVAVNLAAADPASRPRWTSGSRTGTPRPARCCSRSPRTSSRWTAAVRSTCWRG